MNQRGDHPEKVIQLAKEAYGDGSGDGSICIHRYEDILELVRAAYEAGRRTCMDASDPYDD